MKAIIYLALAGLLLPACTKHEGNIDPKQFSDPVPIQLTLAEQEVGTASNTFGLDTFNALYQAGEGQDVVFSPLSLSLALSMCAEGAAGDTYQQFAEVLGWGSSSREEIGSYYKKMVEGLVKADPMVQFTSANSYWVAADLPLLPDYQSLLRNNYSVEGYQVDFSLQETLGRINGWCSDKTDGKIPKMLERLNPYTKLMLINALLFKAPWGLTWEIKAGRNFTKADGTKTKKDFLYVQDKKLSYADYGDFETLDLPYGNGAYQMSIVFPREGKTLAEVLPLLESGHLTYPGSPAEVTLYLPKWSTFYSTDDLLPDILKAQGLTLPFGNQADFSGISTKSLRIDQVIQKTQVDVSEKGTEFAAVTVVGMVLSAAQLPTPRKVTVDLNRPFAYAIREVSSGTVLLLGTLGE